MARSGANPVSLPARHADRATLAHHYVRDGARALGLLLVISASACCPEPVKRDGGGASATDGSSGRASLSAVQADVFDRRCVSSCHDQVSPSAGLRLNRGRSHGALVQQPSGQVTSKMLVAPGAPDQSYLVLKLQGSSGIIGDRMPRLASPLPAAEAEQIRGWITRGAADD